MKKFIHKGFFWEIFRQLKIAGIVAAAILMVSNIGNVSTILITYFTDSVMSYTIPGGFELAAPMMGFIYIAGLVLCFTAYNWLNKRSYSDFYHALPVTRTRIYFSTFLAVMLWMVIGLSAYAAVHALIYFFLGVPFNYLLYLCVYVNMLIGALEVVGVVSLACAISGTRFVNLFASAVILFIPRFLLTVLVMLIRQESPGMLADFTSMSMFFDPSFNIIATPYAPILGSLIGGYSVNYAKPLAMLWSLLYSVFLVLLGCVAFNKRKSETAGIPTRSRLFQGAVRTAIGLPLLLLLAFLLISDGFYLVATVLLILFSFIFYCLYELISTRSPKKMFKAMPLFSICLGIAFLYLLIPKLIVRAEMNAKVTEDNIKGYSIPGSESDGYLADLIYGMGSGNSYSDIALRKIEITDSESIGIIARAYERTKLIYSNDHSGMGMNYSTVMPIRIDRKVGRDLVRNLCFTDAEIERLNELAFQNRDYSDAYYSYPQGRRFYSCTNLTRAEAMEIGKLFEEEFMSLSPYNREMLELNSYGYYGDYFIGESTNVSRCQLTINVFGCVGAENYRNRYKINSLTPKTAQRYIELVNARSGQDACNELDRILAWVENGSKDEDALHYEIWFGDYSGLSYYNTLYSNYNSEITVHAILKLLADASLADGYDDAVQIKVRSDWDEDSYSVFLKISDEDYELISDYLMKEFGLGGELEFDN